MEGETNFEARRPEIIEHLPLDGRREGRSGFHFHDDQSVDHHIQAESGQHHSVITTRLRALSDTSLATLLQPFFVPGLELGYPPFVRANDALVARPRDPLLLYLVARQYYNRFAYDKAGDVMERAADTDLGDPDLIRENLRTLVIARAQRNRCDEAERAVIPLTAAGGSRADIVTSTDWVARCRFAVARGWKPL